MGQGICGRLAAVSTVYLIGLFPPTFAMDMQAGGITETLTALQSGGFNSEPGLRPGPCPTRFDYVVLASFADASNLLSLSTYHFRSEVGLLSPNDDGSGGRPSGGRTRRYEGEVRRAPLVPDDVGTARDHDGRTGNQAHGR